MTESNLKVFVGNNFKVEGQDVLPTGSVYLNRSDVHFDERGNFLTHNLDLSNWQWYYNYLDFMQTAANKNVNAHATYLLDLGYVPVVYLPTCCLTLGTALREALDYKGIPYISIGPTSFVVKYCNFSTVDIWVSKMDAAPLLGVAPTDVTSEMILRKLVICDE